MQISSSAYLSVETLVRLAVQSEDKPCSTRGLAEWINQSVSYTETLMAQLGEAGLVTLRTGPGGGYVLARPADRISVAEIFEAVDAPSDFPNRPLSADTLEDEDIRDLHGTELLWEGLKSYILLFLNGVSLSDLAPQADDPVGESTSENVAVCRVETASTARH